MVIQAAPLRSWACSQWSLPETSGVNDDDYHPPFRFRGSLDKLTVKLDRPKLSPADIKRLEAAMHTKAVSE